MVCNPYQIFATQISLAAKDCMMKRFSSSRRRTQLLQLSHENVFGVVQDSAKLVPREDMIDIDLLYLLAVGGNHVQSVVE